LKAIKIFAILFLIYIGIVVAFESLLGYFQPAGQTTMIITTTDSDGSKSDRVVARLQSNGQLYVAANHWPRAWYHQVLENPLVEVVLAGEEKSAYLAVPVVDEEHDRVNSEHSLPLPFRILTGFPPRYLVRLDPR
jgi:hypothetical protein